MPAKPSYLWHSNFEAKCLELFVPPAQDQMAFIHKLANGNFAWQVWEPLGDMRWAGCEKDLEVAKSKSVALAAKLIWIEGVSKVPKIPIDNPPTPKVDEKSIRRQRKL